MDNKILYYLDKVEKIQNKEFVAPVTCEIDPSNKCPLNCSFCMFKRYLKASQAELNYDTYLRLIYELKTLGTSSITFTGGGEPLMHPKFQDMVRGAISLEFEVGLVTNGVLLKKLSFDILEKFKFIRVSLDAGNRETYQTVKGDDCFEKVVKNIERATKANSTVGISYVVTPQNKHTIEDAIELSEELNVAYIQVKPAIIDGEPFRDYEDPSGKKLIRTPRFSPKDKLPCQIAQLVGIVTADASVYYCCQSRGLLHRRLGSLNSESFKELWTKRMNFHVSRKECSPCRYMSYANAYKDLTECGDLFFEHRRFL
jgi:MoaA/NifB/PqqE/SkfB family radical SAM enzyme